MAIPRHVAVIDIGKTNAKLAIVDLGAGVELEARTAPNLVLDDGPYPHYDVEGVWDFIGEAMFELGARQALEAISITTHGASAALVDANGGLALPVLDYEHAGPDGLAAEYDAVRPPFSTCYSPRLPMGLNLGAQLFWQQRAFPEAFARARWVLTYPQYWAYRLTGVAATEITSIGCHTDLWNFAKGEYSSLVDAMGWRENLPPLRPASDVLGPVSPALVDRLGVAPGTPVLCGIHDSNASLLPHLLSREPGFSVVSSGTWVIVITPGGDLSLLDERRDTLANIDVYGQPTPSARFMGGREFAEIAGTEARHPDAEAVGRVLGEKIMLLPAVQPGSGPFAGRPSSWTRPRATLSDDEVHVAASFYLALMTAECLDLTGAKGDIVVEGPFCGNPLVLAMLAVATGRRVIPGSSRATGTSVGAAMLVGLNEPAGRKDRPVASEPLPLGADAATYAVAWRNAVGD